MFFLLRVAFWLCLVCVLLPSGNKTAAPEAQIDATQAVTAATAAVSDMSAFCERQPEACDAGGKVAVALGQKAEAGARTLYEFVTKLREKAASGNTAENGQARNGRDKGTLTPADMIPAWHPPVPLPPRREARAGA